MLDEAHDIRPDVLGILRVLTNFKWDSRLVVSFVLANQDQCTETELAEKLGISRKSLWERRQRLNIPRKKTRNRGPRRERPTDPDNVAQADTRSDGNPGGESA